MGYGSPGGASTFLDLLDTPETYAGQSLKLAKVNVGETALSLDLLLSFTDWYAGALPTDYPWIFEAQLPFAAAVHQFSVIFKDAPSGEYYVFVAGDSSNEFYKYNLTTKQWHKLANPPAALSGAISHSPAGTKLAAHAANGNVLFIYDIEANTWTSSPVAPQMSGNDVQIHTTVWLDDNDTVWCVVRANLPPWTIKCYRYVVSTTTWTDFANTFAPSLTNPGAMGVTPDGTALYFANCGADHDQGSKYVIAGDAYSTPIDLAAADYFPYSADRHKIWYGSTTGGYAQIRNYVDLSDESLHTDIFPINAQRNKPTNIATGVYGTEIVIVHYRTAAPKNMSYAGTGYWRLAQKTLTDYNLVVFKKPADGYAILAIDQVNNHTVPIYIFSTLALPAGTWEFFYPKDGDYTKLKISGSELK